MAPLLSPERIAAAQVAALDQQLTSGRPSC
jgi:hypothetical protein